MQIRCIVVEDEPLALKKLLGFIDKVDYLKLSDTFDNALDAVSYLKRNSVDLVFLDIQMEDFTGIQFLETVTIRPKVIITTAYDQYAVKGYQLDVADYLLKPYTFERFLQAVERIYHFISDHQSTPAKDFIFVKTEYRLEKIMVSDILYIEGMSEYLRIVTMDRKVMTLQNFRSIEELLPKQLFVRTHKSYVVAINRIESIEKKRIKIKNLLIPISNTYRNALIEKLGIK